MRNHHGELEGVWRSSFFSILRADAEKVMIVSDDVTEIISTSLLHYLEESGMCYRKDDLKMCFSFSSSATIVYLCQVTL